MRVDIPPLENRLNNRLRRAAIEGDCGGVGAVGSHSDMMRCASAAQTSQM
jgi:hypothetical protein